MKVRVGQTFEHKKHPLYSRWKEMRTRCSNPNRKDYHHYGGKGVRVCERWNNFENFVADMGLPPTPKHEIDRKNANGHYCPENCVWATRTEQLNHFSRNRFITAFGLTMTAAAWSRKVNLHSSVIIGRLDNGWNPEVALMIPKFPVGVRPRA